LKQSRCGSWIEISGERLAANLRAFEAAAGSETTPLAVVKASAYGHGAAVCAQILAHAGAQWLGVTHAREGALVAEALAAAALEGDRPDILVMSGSLPGDLETLQKYNLVPVVWTLEQVRWLAGSGLRVHVEVDTGMGRQGVEHGPALDVLLAAIVRAGLKFDGLFTHFCSSEVAGSPLTLEQQRRFEAAIAQAATTGLKPRWLHAGNTSTIDNPAQTQPWLVELAAKVGAKAMARTGLALYGYCLPIEGEAKPLLQPTVQPVMTWKAPLLAVRALAAGESVGYNARFLALAPMRVALLPVGYADGLRRELSSSNLPGEQGSGGWVMVHGQRAAILGRVSMNLTVVDVSNIDDVKAGDEATVLGEGISAEDHARLAGTIAYEILCGIRPTP
jgi:alanine racemase